MLSLFKSRDSIVKSENLSEIDFEVLYGRVQEIYDYIDEEIGRLGSKIEALEQANLKFKHFDLFGNPDYMKAEISSISLDKEDNLIVSLNFISFKIAEYFGNSYFPSGDNFRFESLNITLNVLDIENAIRERLYIIGESLRFWNTSNLQVRDKRNHQQPEETEGYELAGGYKKKVEQTEISHYCMWRGDNTDEFQLHKKLALEKKGDGNYETNKFILSYIEKCLEDEYTVEKVEGSSIWIKIFKIRNAEIRFEVIYIDASSDDYKTRYLDKGIYIAFYGTSFQKSEEIYQKIQSFVDSRKDILDKRKKVSSIIMSSKRSLWNLFGRSTINKRQKDSLTKLENAIKQYEELEEDGEYLYSPIALEYLGIYYKELSIQIKTEEDARKLGIMQDAQKIESALVHVAKEDLKIISADLARIMFEGLPKSGNITSYLEDWLETFKKIRGDNWKDIFDYRPINMSVFCKRHLDMFEKEVGFMSKRDFRKSFYKAMVEYDSNQTEDIDLTRYDGMDKDSLDYDTKKLFEKILVSLARKEMKSDIRLLKVREYDIMDRLRVGKYVDFKASFRSEYIKPIYVELYNDYIDKFSQEPTYDIDFSMFGNLQEQNMNDFVEKILAPNMSFRIRKCSDNKKKLYLEELEEGNINSVFNDLYGYESKKHYFRDKIQDNERYYANKVLQRYYLTMDFDVDGLQPIYKGGIYLMFAKQFASRHGFNERKANEQYLDQNIAKVLAKKKAQGDKPMSLDELIKIIYITDQFDQELASRSGMNYELVHFLLIEKNIELAWLIIENNKDVPDYVFQSLVDSIGEDNSSYKGKKIADKMQYYIAEGKNKELIKYMLKKVDKLDIAVQELIAKKGDTDIKLYMLKNIDVDNSIKNILLEERDDDIVDYLIAKREITEKVEEIITKDSTISTKKKLVKAKKLSLQTRKVLSQSRNEDLVRLLIEHQDLTEDMHNEIAEKRNEETVIKLIENCEIANTSMLLIANREKFKDVKIKLIEDYGPRIDSNVIIKLIKTIDNEIIKAVIENCKIDHDVKLFIAREADSENKCLMIESCDMLEDVKIILAQDKDEDVVMKLMDCRKISYPVKEVIAKGNNSLLKIKLIEEQSLLDDAKIILAQDKDEKVVQCLIENHSIDYRVKNIILTNGSWDNKKYVIENENLLEDAQLLVVQSGDEELIISLVENQKINYKVKEVIATTSLTDAKVKMIKKHTLIDSVKQILRQDQDARVRAALQK